MVMRRAAVLSFLVACRHEVVIPPVVVAPLTSTSATPMPRPVPEGFTYDAFTSTDENEFVGWQILLAWRDDGARVLVRSRGSASLPVELAGTVKPEGARLRIHATAGSAKDALRFDAFIDGDTLIGVLRTDTGREEVTAKRGVPALDRAFEMKLGGEIGGRRVHVDWKQNETNAKATVTDLAGSRVLEGTMRDGRFTLAGGGVTMRGVFSNFTAGLAEWIENGEERPMTLDTMRVEIPAQLALGNVRVAAAERWVRGAAGCPSSYEVYPDVHGLDWKTESAIDRLLHPGASVPSSCTGGELAFLGAVWSTSTYTITASRPQWFAIRTSAYAYMGGAHGMWGDTCDVASLSSGKVGSLQSELSPASLSKLGALVRKTLLAGAPGQSLMDLGFNAEDPNVTIDRVMCVVEDHGALALEVVYQSDMDPAGNFRFTEVRPRIPAATARALFPAGSAGALVFQ